MITLEIFLLGLTIVSILTGLTTEAVKNVFVENNVTYRANTLAGVVATVLSLAVGVGYVAIAGLTISSQIVVCLVALVFGSWLCAMVGYDKVMQAIGQFKTTKKDDE